VKRLLLVGDRRAVAHGLRTALRHGAGFQVVGFLDGRADLGPSVAGLAPDVVLVDDMARPQDALAALRQLAERAPEAQVLLLTDDRSASWHRQAFAAGAHVVVAKTVHPLALGTLVRETAQGNVVHRPSGRGIATPVVVPELAPLTDREREILALVAEGLTNAGIARRLWVSEPTVKFHLANLYRKLGVANRTEASRHAHAHGLVAPPPALAAA